MTQPEYFQLLLRRSGNRHLSEMVPTLGKLLKTSPAGIYKRARGHTALKFDELIALGRHFGVYPDHRTTDDGREVDTGFLDVPGRLEAVAREVQAIRQSGDEIRYGSTEIPVFYLFGYPALSMVKQQLWQHVPRREVRYEMPPFPTELPPTKLLRSVYEDYRAIPRREIWGTGMLDNLLAQITYLQDTAALSVEHPLYETIFVELDQLLDELRHLGSQSEDGPIVYYNMFNYATNFILRVSSNRTQVYIPGRRAGFFRYTHSSVTLGFRQDWQDKAATLGRFSELSPRDRGHLFRNLRRRIRLVREHG